MKQFDQNDSISGVNTGDAAVRPIIDMANPADARVTLTRAEQKPAGSDILNHDGSVNFSDIYQNSMHHHDGHHHGHHHHHHHHHRHHDGHHDNGDNSSGGGHHDQVGDSQAAILQKLTNEIHALEAELAKLEAYLNSHGSGGDTPVPPAKPPVGGGGDTPVPPTKPPVGGGGDTPVPPTHPSPTLEELIKQSPLGFNAIRQEKAGSKGWEQIHERNVAHAADAAKQGSALEFFGDSITANLAKDKLSTFATDFAAQRPTAFGSGGDTASDLLYRINHGEFQGHPKVAVINIGTNDTYRIKSGAESIDDVTKETEKIIQSIRERSPDTKVLLMGILPKGGDMDIVKQLNQKYSGLADGKNVVFSDIGSNFVDSKGKIRPELYSDTVHPNAAGNQVWEKALKGTINQMLQSPADHIGGPGGHTTHEVKFGPTPSWANDTSVINNNRSKVPPSFYAQRIGDHATYLEASINQPTGGFDEGEMIDERGMDPSKLTTIPMYGADNNWLTNKTNGKYYGEIQVPKDLLVLREAHTYKSGISVNGNSAVTIIDPNGKEWSFAKTYIGPDKSLRENGNVLIGVPDGHGASYMGNEGMLTLDELQRAMADGTAPAHALNLTVPNDIESNTDGGFVYPARAADHGYQTAYKGTNPNLKQGSHLAVPKGVTAEELGLKTNLGKALLASMEEFGGYVDDSTHPGAGISIEAQYGGTKQIGMEEHNGNAFRKSDFAQDFSKIMAAAKIIPPAY